MEPTEQSQHPIDYLNQIAAPAPKPGLSDKLFPVVLIAGAVIALFVGVFALLNSGTSNKSNLMRLSAQLQTLQSIADTSKSTITSSSLRGTNTNLSLFLTSANQDIASPLAASDIDPAKLDPKITASEDGSDLKKRLEDARISGYFDRTYAREMSDQLAMLIGLMKEIDAHTKNKSLKDFLATTEHRLTPIQKQFADFNAATT